MARCGCHAAAALAWLVATVPVPSATGTEEATFLQLYDGPQRHMMDHRGLSEGTVALNSSRGVADNRMSRDAAYDRQAGWSPQELRQLARCVGNVSWAFIGDSQVRDLAVAMARVLWGQSPREASEACLGHDPERPALARHFPNGPKNRDAACFPENFGPEAEDRGWHVHVYHTRHYHASDWGDVQKIVLGEGRREYDAVFVNMGLHERPRWERNMTDYLERFLKPFADIALSAKGVPVIWLPMNKECPGQVGDMFPLQAAAVDDANALARHYATSRGVRFLDTLLPAAQVCQLMDPACGGLHAKQWVDVVRARRMLGRLCTKLRAYP